MVLAAVVDTNVIFSGLLTMGGNSGRVIRAWREGYFRLVLAEAQFSEIEEVTGRSKFLRNLKAPPELVAAVLDEFRAGMLSGGYPPPPIRVRDPDDDILLAAAVSERVEYLVTGDQDLLVLHGDPRLGTLQIVTPRAFLDELDRIARLSTGR